MDIETMVKATKRGEGDYRLEILDKLMPLIVSSSKKYNITGEYEDNLQEGRLTILRAIDEYDLKHKVNFLGFIKSRLKYLYLNKEKEKNISLDFKTEEGITLKDLLKSDINIEVQVLEDSLIGDTKKDLYKLSKREREIIYLYIYGYKNKEIMEILDLKYQTVANIKYKGLKKLRKLMVKKS